jgi:hypothetical protein
LYNPEPAEGDTSFFARGDANQYWHKDVFDNPAALNFWFDFLGEGT